MATQAINPLKRTRQEALERASKRSRPVVSQPKSVLLSDPGSEDDSDEPSGSQASSEDDETDVEDDKQAMLAALEAHGRAMFASLDTPKAGPSKIAERSKAQQAHSKKDKALKQSRNVLDGLDGIFSEDSEEDSELEEGEGFDEDDGDDGISAQDDYDEESVQEDEGDDDVAEEVQTVVFGGDAGRSTLDSTSKADFKRFMSSKSSKMMNIQEPDVDVPGRRNKGSAEDQAEEEEDRSNATLDKELHGLLMTSLLPSASTAAKPSEKRNQMSSRLLELASIAGLGEGSSELHSTAYKSQPTKIRSNILKAQERRAEKARAEAQASGSWVKGSGGLGDIGGKDKGLTLAAKKRQEKEKERRSKTDERGLSMGVGRFKGGVLTLSKSEIAKGSAVPEKFSVGKKKGKGGKKGGKK